MKTSTEIKEAVKEKYAQIAKGEITEIAPKSSCCGSGSNAGSSCCSSSEFVNMALDYIEADRKAIPEGADLGLGCGTPTAFAELKEGMTVLDLGSGAGIDCFIASKYVGSTGKVIGVDMTEVMIQKANENKTKVNASNVEFRLGEIENLPVQKNTVDRVISNCVINLVPDKAIAFKEIHRVLKPGGKFTVSDIVVDGEITDEERRNASLWAGCISGALKKTEYLSIIEQVGFKNVTIVSEKRYDYKLQNDAGLFSITVSATK
jgi:arsenite methyltransferase